MKASGSDLFADLTSEDESRAEAAAERLAQLSAMEAQKWLDDLAHRPPVLAADARWWLTRAAAGLPAEVEATPFLITALKDAEAGVRQCAAVGLRERRSPQAVPALISALADPDELVRRLCSEALAVVGTEAIPALLDAFQSGRLPARIAAARALAKIGDHRSIPALIAALDDNSALIAYWANIGLERMGVGMSFFIPE